MIYYLMAPLGLINGLRERRRSGDVKWLRCMMVGYNYCRICGIVECALPYGNKNEELVLSVAEL